MHRWRDYETPAGRRPVKEFLSQLSDEDAAEVVAAMKDVSRNGLSVARHLRSEIWEVRAQGQEEAFRVLFAKEGSKGRVLLALHASRRRSRGHPPR